MGIENKNQHIESKRHLKLMHFPEDFCSIHLEHEKEDEIVSRQADVLCLSKTKEKIFPKEAINYELFLKDLKSSTSTAISDLQNSLTLNTTDESVCKSTKPLENAISRLDLLGNSFGNDMKKASTKSGYSLNNSILYNVNQEVLEVPEESPILECTLCKKIFSGVESLNQHLKSKRHLNLLEKHQFNKSFLEIKENQKENEMQDRSNEEYLTYSNKSLELESSDNLFKNERKCIKIDSTKDIADEEITSILECKLCKKIFTGIESQEQHFQSRRHIDLLKNHQIQDLMKNM